MFKAVVFDLGDTLILTDKWDYDDCLKRLLDSLKRDNVILQASYDEFKHVYFETRNRMYLEAEKSLEEVDFRLRIAETLNHLGHRSEPTDPVVTRAIEAFMDSFVEDVRMDDYVPTILKQLKQNYRLGLVSNFAYSQGLWKILQRFDLAKFFDAVVVSGEFGLRKPNPKIFQRILELLDVDTSATVFVGDSLKADIEGAKKLGIKTILVENVGLRKNPYAVPGELDPVPVKPDKKIPNLKGLIEALASL